MSRYFFYIYYRLITNKNRLKTKRINKARERNISGTIFFYKNEKEKAKYAVGMWNANHVRPLPLKRF